MKKNLTIDLRKIGKQAHIHTHTPSDLFIPTIPNYRKASTSSTGVRDDVIDARETFVTDV